LGSMFVGGPEVIEEVQEKLCAEAFYVPAHQTFFTTLCSLHGCGQAIDLITYCQQLEDEGILEGLGGRVRVTALCTFVPSAVNVIYYLEIVRSKWLLRSLIKSCTESMRQAYEEQSDVTGLVENYVSNAIEISQLGDWRESIRPVSEFVPEAVAQIAAAYYGRGKVTGLPTGFNDFDRMTNGLEKGYVYVFGARPAMGKTSLGLSVAERVSVVNAEKGVRTQIFSLEMTGVQLARRMILSAANVSLQRMRDGFLSKDDLPRVKAAAERLVRSHVLIDDKAGLNVFEFRARSRRAVVKRKAGLIVIDYLQMMHGVSRRAHENRQAEVSEVMQAIAETAKELQVPIIVLAQLNRKVEERKWGIPEMQDLRESGDVENYAHLIALLWRPEYYAQTDTKKEALAKYLSSETKTFDTDDLVGYAQAIIVKQREGPVGPVPLRFVKDFARFENVTEKLYSNRGDERQGL
jgi:replicative DNA helicase